MPYIKQERLDNIQRCSHTNFIAYSHTETSNTTTFAPLHIEAVHGKTSGRIRFHSNIRIRVAYGSSHAHAACSSNYDVHTHALAVF